MKTLDEIMLSYKTDKSSKFHDYCKIYDKLFTPYRDKDITFLEIGLGNLNDPNQGESILGFREFFHKGWIVGIDVDDKSFFNKEERIQVYQGSSDDSEFLRKVAQFEQGFDIVVDDGPHWRRHILVAFETLFPHLKEGGTYVCEDVHTNYWRGWQGSPITDDMKLDTTMNYFFKLCHCVNLQDPNVKHWPDVPVLYYHTPSFFKDIESISFYRSLIIVKKK